MVLCRYVNLFPAIIPNLVVFLFVLYYPEILNLLELATLVKKSTYTNIYSY